MTKQQQIIQDILVNFKTSEIESIKTHLADLNITSLSKSRLKPIILKFLRRKYDLQGCPGKGQRNYWLLRGFSTEEAEKNFKEYSSVYDTTSGEAIMKRHGVSKAAALDIQKSRAKKARSTIAKKSPEEIDRINRSKANTLENLIKRHGLERGSELNKQRLESLKDNSSLDGFKARFGDALGLVKYNEFRQKVSFNNTLQGYIERYGEIQGPIKWGETSAKKSKGQTLAGRIELHGEIEGTRIFNKRNKLYVESFNDKTPDELALINKTKGKKFEELVSIHGKPRAIEIVQSRLNSVGKASKESLRVFIPFYKYLRKNSIKRKDIHLGVGGSKEYFLNRNGRFVLFDFTIKSKRVIIEFNGVAFHPKNAEQDWVSPFSKEPAELVYERDQGKLLLAEDAGFDVITIWSDVSPEDNLKQIINKYEQLQKNKINI